MVRIRSSYAAIRRIAAQSTKNSLIDWNHEGQKKILLNNKSWMEHHHSYFHIHRKQHACTMPTCAERSKTQYCNYYIIVLFSSSSWLSYYRSSRTYTYKIRIIGFGQWTLAMAPMPKCNLTYLSYVHKTSLRFMSAHINVDDCVRYPNNGFLSPTKKRERGRGNVHMYLFYVIIHVYVNLPNIRIDEMILTTVSIPSSVAQYWTNNVQFGRKR